MNARVTIAVSIVLGLLAWGGLGVSIAQAATPAPHSWSDAMAYARACCDVYAVTVDDAAGDAYSGVSPGVARWTEGSNDAGDRVLFIGVFAACPIADCYDSATPGFRSFWDQGFDSSSGGVLFYSDLAASSPEAVWNTGAGAGADGGSSDPSAATVSDAVMTHVLDAAQFVGLVLGGVIGLLAVVLIAKGSPRVVSRWIARVFG